MSYTANHSLINYQSGPVPPTARGFAVARSVAKLLRLWGSRIRERRAFPELNERELSDLRLSRWDVERELAKPFWRG
jgi:uncharacterized protein YjiS (DUF1127 family)